MTLRRYVRLLRHRLRQGCLFINRQKGPLALPGDYQVKLTVRGKSQTAPLHLAIDPRTKGAESALQKQFALAVQVNGRISQLHQAVNEIRDLRSQIKDLHTRFG